jgi:radical SAM superfamily enzyme YgiQ (UPF0313 family)
LFKCLGNYNRKKPIDSAIDEMQYFKEKESLELIFFDDENFLSMKNDRLCEFVSQYKKKVNLPFVVFTRAEGLFNEGNMKLLKEANCITIGIGVECGNEELRKQMLNKNIPNYVYEKAFDNCHKYGIRTTANIMIGLPFETEENIYESIDFCRKLQPGSISLSIFAPYHGTKLRQICVENSFMEDRYYDNISVNNTTILDMTQLPKERLEELYCKFNSLVYEEYSQEISAN